ncbi:MAG TPA: hypothetical protein VL752_20995 [Acidisoma sp.]|uniref:hypothetical protein n=1 Tax=Acidisoma sp. TaxID=1872115 RepID=UPI002CBB87CC|nr:hypothetical protein [Acidisoma sp.]HTI03431.1 hypothetical protein [Acidisoma sp.]
MTRKIVVYSYWTWIPGEGLGQIAPTKRSQAQIEALRGLIILTSAEEVDAADLDADGSYRQDSQPEEAAV